MKANYKTLLKLYEIQVIDGRHKTGIKIKSLARALNESFLTVYNRCYKYWKRGLTVEISGKKGRKEVKINTNGINRVKWIKANSDRN